MDAGVRLRDNLPFRMLLIDEASAVCAVPASGSHLLRGERVMVLLIRVFETTWVDAQPLERVLSRASRRTGTPTAVAGGPQRRLRRAQSRARGDPTIAGRRPNRSIDRTFIGRDTANGHPPDCRKIFEMSGSGQPVPGGDRRERTANRLTLIFNLAGRW